MLVAMARSAEPRAILGKANGGRFLCGIERRPYRLETPPVRAAEASDGTSTRPAARARLFKLAPTQAYPR